GDVHPVYQGTGEETLPHPQGFSAQIRVVVAAHPDLHKGDLPVSESGQVPFVVGRVPVCPPLVRSVSDRDTGKVLPFTTVKGGQDPLRRREHSTFGKDPGLKSGHVTPQTRPTHVAAARHGLSRAAVEGDENLGEVL